MNEYIKIKTSFYEKLLFLFASIINKKHIISNSIEQKYNTINNQTIPDINIVEDIPDKIDIPFFELDNSNVESNLK